MKRNWILRGYRKLQVPSSQLSDAEMTPLGRQTLSKACQRSTTVDAPCPASFLSSIWMISGEICGLYNLKTGWKPRGERSPRELRQAVLLHHLFGLAPARKEVGNDRKNEPRASVSLICFTFWPSFKSQKRPEASNLTPGPLSSSSS